MDDLIQTLRDSLPNLSPRDQSFASSLLSQYGRRGYLTERQAPYLQQLIERASKPAPAPVEVGDLAAVYELFQKAGRSGLRWPTIVLACMSAAEWDALQRTGEKPASFLELRLHVAGANSSEPGSIAVVEQGSRRWVGRIHAGGVFEPTKARELPAAVADTLQAFAADPAGIASAHGFLTGRCTFCNAPLTDERSTAVGYGPVCAKKWGVPWGKMVTVLEDGRQRVARSAACGHAHAA